MEPKHTSSPTLSFGGVPPETCNHSAQGIALAKHRHAQRRRRRLPLDRRVSVISRLKAAYRDEWTTKRRGRPRKSLPNAPSFKAYAWAEGWTKSGGRWRASA